MSQIPVLVKDPGSVVDVGFHWADELGADTLSTSAWVAEDGVSLSSPSMVGTDTVVWLSGGAVVGYRYRIVNTVTTAGGRTLERSIDVQIENL